MTMKKMTTMNDNMIITQDQLKQLTRIYNTFFEISTKGEDTLVMADCLRAFEQILLSIKNNKAEEG